MEMEKITMAKVVKRTPYAMERIIIMGIENRGDAGNDKEPTLILTKRVTKIRRMAAFIRNRGKDPAIKESM